MWTQLGTSHGMKGLPLEVPHRLVGVIEEHRALLRVPAHDGLGLVGAGAIEVHRDSDGEDDVLPLVEGRNRMGPPKGHSRSQLAL